MELVSFLLPAALGLGFIGLLGFFWAVRSGQFDDLDSPPRRVLIDPTPESESDSDSLKKSP